MSGEYLGDFEGTETLTIWFDTFDSNGASATAAGSPAFATSDIEVYKGSSMTQRSSDSGYALIDTDGIDLDGTTGINGFTIDISDDTDSGFYATGNDYIVVVTGMVIDGQSVNFIAARFSIQNRNSSIHRYGLDHLVHNSVTGTDVTDNSIVAYLASAGATADWDDYDNTADSLEALHDRISNIASGSAAISTVAESYTLTTGTQSSGTISDTLTKNAVRHEHTDTGGSIDLYYQFDVGGSGVAVAIDFFGRLNGGNDSIGIFAYNWGDTAWDQIGTLSGINGSTDEDIPANLTIAHTGTGANLGKVRIRFYEASALSSATLRIDYAIVSYSVVSQSVGYAGGQIWVDTVNGVAGTETYVNGVADNPVSTLADALTLSSSVGVKSFNIANGSSLTLTSTLNNYSFDGLGYSLALGSQDIGGSFFYGAKPVTGTATNSNGSQPIFDRCVLATATVTADTLFLSCNLATTLTLTSTSGVTADTLVVNKSQSGVAGSGSPHIDASGVTKTTNINIRKWSGGLELTLNSHCTVSLEGTGGTVTINGTGGSINVRGIFEDVVDNSSASVSISEIATLNREALLGYDDGAIWVDTNGANTGTLDYVDGTADNPVNSWANALTMSASLGISKFRVVTGSSITLTANSDSYDIRGENWTLALGGQSVASAFISGAYLSGVSSGNSLVLKDCSIGASTFGTLWAKDCRVTGAVTLTATGGHFFQGCFSPTSGAPIIDLASGVGAQTVCLSPLYGGMEIRNCNAGDLVHVEGAGELILASSCTDGDIEIAGSFAVTDNSAGSTVRYDDKDPSAVADAVWDEAFSGHTTVGTYGKLVKNLGEGVVSGEGQVVDGSPSLATTTSFDTNLTFSDDTYYDDKVLVFIDGALAGQSKPIKTSTASGGNVTFDSIDAFVAPPANGDSFIILATHVHPISQIAEQARIEMDANSTQLTAIVADTNEMQGDLTNGGRLDLIFDELTTQGDTNEAKLDTIDTNVDAVLVDTNEMQGDLTNGGRLDLILDELTTQGDTNEAKLDTIDTNVDAVLVDTASTIPALITALNDPSVADVLTTTMTESYASKGSAPSLAQILFELRALLAEHAASGTTLTAKRLDGSTTAATYTFDDASNPTSITRAT